MRQLTAWEKYQIEGMRTMTLDELVVAQGKYAQAISKEETAKLQKGMQNHQWPWQEEEKKVANSLREG